MSIINSRRHIWKYYVSVAFATVFFVALGTLLLVAFFRQNKRFDLMTKDGIMPIFGILCIGFAIFSLFRYRKNAPNISIDYKFISFDDEVQSIENIDKIVLSGKQPFSYGIDFPMEATTIRFKDGSTRYIFDEMYSNSWEIKSFLKRFVIEKSEYLRPDEQVVSPDEIDIENYYTFSGVALLSLRGISLWSFVLSMLFIFSTSTVPLYSWAAVVLLGVSVIWIVTHSYLMHYFQVSNSLFVVRNHIYFWWRKPYRLSEINEIVFETKGKMPNCLRIITKDYKSRLFPAGTLSDSTWIELKGILETAGVLVRNECIF